MKTKFLFALSIFLCSTAALADWNGSDTKEPSTTKIDNKTYYQISSAEELAWFSREVARGSDSINAILTADFSVSSKSIWSPIGGSDKTPFSGKFNGDGHTISNLYFPDEFNNAYVGLFGKIGSKGAVRNLTIKSVNFTSVGEVHYAGGIAGYNDGVIENCTVEGVVKSISSSNEKAESMDSYAGGITGYNSGSISNVSNLATASATTSIPGKEGSSDAFVGGIAGMNKGSIFYSKNGAKTLSASAPYGVGFAGGLVGFNEGIIKSSFSYSEKIEGMLAGGIVGALSDGALVGCMYNSSFFDENLDVFGASNGGQDVENGKRSTANMQTPEFVWIMNTVHNTEGNADVWRYKASNYPVFSQDSKSSSVFAVTFNIQGALVTTFTKTDGTAEIPDVPAPEGKVLDAWYGDKLGKVDSKTKITKDDTLTAKYITPGVSSSSAVPEKKSSSSSAKSSSSVASSTSKPASSSSVTSSSSNKTTSSSSKKDDAKSSSSKTTVLAENISQQLHISVGERMLQIAGAPVNAPYMIADMQGRRIQSGRVTLSEFTIPMQHTGTFIIRIGSQSKTFRIR